MLSPLDLDASNVVEIDLGSAEFKANAHRHMADWATRKPFYVLGQGQPQVIVGAVANAAKTLRHLDWVEVDSSRGQIEDGKVAYYQVTLKRGFRLE